jgi:hypothetical protein
MGEEPSQAWRGEDGLIHIWPFESRLTVATGDALAKVAHARGPQTPGQPFRITDGDAHWFLGEVEMTCTVKDITGGDQAGLDELRALVVDPPTAE